MRRPFEDSEDASIVSDARHLTPCKSLHYHFAMLTRSVRHKGLKRLILQDDPSGLPGQYAVKIRTIVSFLQDMESEDETGRRAALERAHRLTGDRRGIWRASVVSKNWRLTFRIDKHELEIPTSTSRDYH